MPKKTGTKRHTRKRQKTPFVSASNLSDAPQSHVAHFFAAFPPAQSSFDVLSTFVSPIIPLVVPARLVSDVQIDENYKSPIDAKKDN